MRKSREMVVDRAESLSERLGRPVDEIRSDGLSAYDFSPSRRVRLEYEDGSCAEFRYAFACVRKEASRVVVFTEHCGYLEFALLPEMAVVEVSEGHYRHELP